MAEAPSVASPETLAALPENVKQGLSASVKYLVSNLLSEKHYSKISTSLASRWDSFQSMSAAMKLMEQHGVVITPEEQQRLSGLTEAQMIESLVSKMPQQSKEQFQHFFLQLQLIVSTATRVRQALETGRADLVEQAMEDAESTGISQYILKMSIVQAGSEVTNLKKQHAAFMKDAEGKLSRLVKAQEDMMVAKGRLAKALSELAIFQSTQNENIKKVLMTFAGGSATALLHGCFSSWFNHTKKMKLENMIYEEYREAIEAAEQRLIDAKSEQLKALRQMINKRNQGSQEALILEVFDIWKQDLLESKWHKNSKEDIEAMEAKLKAMNDTAADNAKKVLARTGIAGGVAFRDLCFAEWSHIHQNAMKNKELERLVKEEEEKIKAFINSHADKCKGVLSTLNEATDTGLLHEVFVNWWEHVKEEKQINEFANVMNGANGKFGAFGDRNKASAKSVMERAQEHGNTMIYLKVFGAWRLDTVLAKMLTKNQARIDGKRQQLVGVQQMFRKFANQLEGNIAPTAEDNRKLEDGPAEGWGRKNKRAARGGMTKEGEGSVSLPDIHAKNQGARPSIRDEFDSGRKMAWS